MLAIGVVIWATLFSGLLDGLKGITPPGISRVPEAMAAVINEAGFLDYPESELDLVVRTVACECGPNEPLGCYSAVAYTIRIRAEERSLAYEQVVLEPYQYSCWNTHIPASLKQLRDDPQEVLPLGYYQIIKGIVMSVLSGEAQTQFEGANHYYSRCLVREPFWVSQATYLGEVGCHRFYRIGR